MLLVVMLVVVARRRRHTYYVSTIICTELECTGRNWSRCLNVN